MYNREFPSGNFLFFYMQEAWTPPEKESVHASCCIRMEEIAKSVIVRADDFQHLIENLFHLPHQCELGAGAVEIVIRASNMEIMVALQIVS